MQHCSVISTRSFIKKKKDMGAFTFPRPIGLLHFAKAMCDVGESINLIPLSIQKKLGLWDPKPTTIWLVIANQTINRLISVLHDVLVKVELFIFQLDILILDCEVDFKVHIILGRSVLATRRSVVDIQKGHTKFSFNNKEATFNIIRSM